MFGISVIQAHTPPSASDTIFMAEHVECYGFPLIAATSDQP